LSIREHLLDNGLRELFPTVKWCLVGPQGEALRIMLLFPEAAAAGSRWTIIEFENEYVANIVKEYMLNH
jgi:hypothetical protein